MSGYLGGQAPVDWGVVAGCAHECFESSCEVHRIVEYEGGPVVAHNAQIMIRCSACGVHFSFLGLPRGINLSEPMAGYYGAQARLPVRPLAEADMAVSIEAQSFPCRLGERGR